MKLNKLTASVAAAVTLAFGAAAATAATASADNSATQGTTTSSYKAAPTVKAGDHRGSAIGLPHNQHTKHLGQPGNH